jgi:hypothetical protein
MEEKTLRGEEEALLLILSYYSGFQPYHGYQGDKPQGEQKILN